MEARKIVSTADLSPHVTALNEKLKAVNYSQSSIRRMSSIWEALFAVVKRFCNTAA